MIQTPGRMADLVTRVQASFLDNPTLTLSAARLRFAVDYGTCAAVFDTLVDAGVLTEREGAYRRRIPRSA